jgi:arylsulfatase A-like enzyme
LVNRRQFISTLASAACGSRAFAQSPAAPNVVLINCDDLGYGDLGCYGSRMKTPNIDRMAAEGARFTHFYSASPVCSPARAALLTGRYAVRVGVTGVLDPSSEDGLTETEPTLGDALKRAGYRTACVGKWHLGSRSPFHPNSRGFDEFFGLLYSHDMWPRPLYSGREIVEQPAALESLSERFSARARGFVRTESRQPFFLYFAPTAPHIPLDTGARFRRSAMGAYGNSMEELDAVVGELMETLRETGQDERTLVLLTSDNGPWYQGSTGGLRGRKGETLDGGMRVPLVARWPGRIPAGHVESRLATQLDLFPTLARLAGAAPPSRTDGVDIEPLLVGWESGPERDVFLYFDYSNLQCARWGPWKLHMTRYTSRAWSPAPAKGKENLPLRNPELYNLDQDPSESYDCAAQNPEVVKEIQLRVAERMTTMPTHVQDIWRETLKRRVEWTPAGALPIEQA